MFRWQMRWLLLIISLRSMSILGHLSLDKMANILADDNFNCIFLNETDICSQESKWQ